MRNPFLLLRRYSVTKSRQFCTGANASPDTILASAAYRWRHFSLSDNRGPTPGPILSAPGNRWLMWLTISFFASTGQAIRASLSINATAATLRWVRDVSCAELLAWVPASWVSRRLRLNSLCQHVGFGAPALIRRLPILGIDVEKSQTEIDDDKP
jgi:hypothetical protein